MKKVTQIAIALLLATSVSNYSFAQEMKAHKCGSMCKDGKHMYAHGEKEHECTEACMGSMKDHQCTSGCKDGKHLYAHGEKGHECTKACKKMMKNIHWCFV